MRDDIVLYEGNNELSVAMTPVIPLEPIVILGVTLNGRTALSISPRSLLTTRAVVKAYQAMDCKNVEFVFGKLYLRGEEPTPIPCPPDAYFCSEADMGFYEMDDHLFLPMPVMAAVEWWYGWDYVITYFNGHSEMRGTITPISWKLYAYTSDIIRLSSGEERVFTFPELTSAPSGWAQIPNPKISDAIRGTFDILVIITGTGNEIVSLTSFKDVLTVGTSPTNPDQVTIEEYVEKIRRYTIGGPF